MPSLLVKQLLFNNHFPFKKGVREITVFGKTLVSTPESVSFAFFFKLRMNDNDDKNRKIGNDVRCLGDHSVRFTATIRRVRTSLFLIN